MVWSAEPVGVETGLLESVRMPACSLPLREQGERRETELTRGSKEEAFQQSVWISNERPLRM